MRLDERYFPDGYCDCRCGPMHHGLAYSADSDAIDLVCTYHRRTCARIERSALMAMGAHDAYVQLEPMVGIDRAKDMVREMLQNFTSEMSRYPRRRPSH